MLLLDIKKTENCYTGKPQLEKQNASKWKPQKPLNRPTVVPKPAVVKPCKPPVVGSTPGRRMNPNMDQKLQNIEKRTLSKSPVTPQQRVSYRITKHKTSFDNIFARLIFVI